MNQDASAELSPNSITSHQIAVRYLARLTAALVILLALGAFFLSYESLRDLASTSGAISPGRAWMFPLVVDGAIVIFSLSALRASIAGERHSWYMGLVIAVTIASVGLNVAHASGGILAHVMAAMPPLLLFGAFESLMKQVGSALGAGDSRPVMNRTGSQTASTSERRKEVRDLVGKGMSRNAIARKLGVSSATIRRDLAVEKLAVRNS